VVGRNSLNSGLVIYGGHTGALPRSSHSSQRSLVHRVAREEVGRGKGGLD
jgi:hypothetical protein